MHDFKHIHTVKAAVQALIALVIGNRVQHALMHQPVIIAMKHFPYQKEILFQTVRKASQPPDKILLQTVCHIQAQAVDLKFFYPDPYSI